MMDWEMFRPQLKRCFKKKPKGPGGRTPYDYVLMFKILIFQRLYNLSDAQMQYQILDRLSFQRFLGQGLYARVPDENTILLFREVLSKRGMIEKLFSRYSAHLEKQGLIANSGSIIDASFVEVPHQRNSREENQTIKEGKIPDDWTVHVFAHIANSMNGFRIRSIGMMRARSNIGLINLVYNIVRSGYLQGV